MTRHALLRSTCFLLWLVIGLTPVGSWAVTHLSTLEWAYVGNSRALQGVTAGDGEFYTSKGGLFNSEYLYRFDHSWNFKQEADADPGLGQVSHVGDLTADADYVFAPLSDFVFYLNTNFFAIARYDRSTMSYQGHWDLSSDFDTSGEDTDISGVDRYHNSIYAIEYVDSGVTTWDPRVIRYDFVDENGIALAASYGISNQYANGIDFYGNYMYVSHGSQNDPYGMIDVYRVDDLNTLGVNRPIHQYTFDLETHHAEGLTFDGTDFWIAQEDYVTRLETPALPEYVTWVGSGSASGGSGTSWAGYYNWDGKPTAAIDAYVSFTSTSTLIINSNATAKNLYVDGSGAISLETGCSLSSSAMYLGEETGSQVTFLHTGGTNTVDLLHIGASPGSSGTYELSGGALAATTFNIAEGGTGSLTISGGGQVTNTHGSIGQNPGSTGNVLVDGSGSIWTSSDDLQVGAEGSGILTVRSGGEVEAYQIAVGPNGRVEGNGLISSAVTNSGAVAPGNSAGILTIAGNYTQSAAGTLEIELGGTVVGSEFDMLDITGSASLSGMLDVALIDMGRGEYSPFAGDTFEIMTAASGLLGTFDDGVSLPALNGLLTWNVHYDTVNNRVLLEVSSPLTADFDGDGDVDHSDLIQWQGDLGLNGHSDTDSDGDSDGFDFLAWQRQYTGDLDSLSASTTVPEPPSAMLMANLAAIVACLRISRTLTGCSRI